MNWPIEELVPQRAPFLFVDKVLDFGEDFAKTDFEIKADNVLVDNGALQAAGLIENIAQTGAALEGCNAKSSNDEVKVGFIGSVKKLEVNKEAKVGDVLQTEIKILTNAIGVNVAEGKVFIDGEEVAKCVLNIFLKED